MGSSEFTTAAKRQVLAARTVLVGRRRTKAVGCQGIRSNVARPLRRARVRMVKTILDFSCVAVDSFRAAYQKR